MCVCESVSIIQIQFSSYLQCTTWMKKRNEIQMCGKFLYYYYKQNEPSKKSLIYIFWVFCFYSFLSSSSSSPPPPPSSMVGLYVVVTHNARNMHTKQNNRASLSANKNESILILPKTRTKKKSRAEPSSSTGSSHIAGVLGQKRRRFAHIIAKDCVFVSRQNAEER